MSGFAKIWAWEQKGLNTTERCVLMGLAEFYTTNNGCFPSLQTIAERLEVSVDTIHRTIDKLIEKNFVSKTKRFGESGRRTSNAYELHFTPINPPTTNPQNADSPIRKMRHEQQYIEQDTIPSELEDPVLSIFANHEEPPESSNKTFWDEAVGMLMGMGVADVTARTFVGRCLKLTNGDQTEILRVMEAALAAGVRDPIPYLSAALGGKKKKETVVKNKAIADAFAALEAESEKRKAQWAKELGEDYTGGGGQKDNEVLQSEPVVGLGDVHVKRSKGARKVHPRRAAQIVRPLIGDRDEMQVPANDSGDGGGSAKYAEGETPKPEFRVIHTNENGGLNG